MNTKGMKFLAVLAVLAMAFAIVVMVDQADNDDAAVYDYAAHTADTVRVYDDMAAYEADTAGTGGTLKSLNAALNKGNYTAGEVWVFKPGIYNVTYRASSDNGTETGYDANGKNYGSVLVFGQNLTIIGATNVDGSPATTFYADYSLSSSVYPEEGSRAAHTSNDLIAVGNSTTEVTIKNVVIMPIVYSASKYHGEFEGYVPDSGTWYTPNVAITSCAKTLTLKNVQVVPNTLGVKDSTQTERVAYMMDDGGNIQSYPTKYMFTDYATTQNLILEDFVTYGGIGVDKIATNVTLKNATFNFGGDKVGDQRTLIVKPRDNGKVAATLVSVENLTVNLSNVNKCRQSPLGELQDKLLDGTKNPIFSNTTINVNCDLTLTKNISIPATVTLNVNGKLTVGESIEVTNAGKIMVNGSIIGEDLITNTGEGVIVHKAAPEVPKYDVVFKNGEEVMQTLSVEKGKLVPKPVDPTEDGKRFKGWYTDSACTKQYDFNTPVNSNLTLYAGFVTQCTIMVPVPDTTSNYTVSDNVIAAQGKIVLDMTATNSFTFTVTPSAGYTAVVSINDALRPAITEAQEYTINDLSKNVTVSIKISENGSTATKESSKAIVENVDGTTTTVDTTVETSATGAKTITETTATSGASAATSATEATVSQSSAKIDITATNTDVAAVSQAIVKAITEDATAENKVAIDVKTQVQTVSIPASVLNNDKVSGLTVAVNEGSANSASITIPANAIPAGELGETIAVSVKESAQTVNSAAIGNSTATASFELNIEGSTAERFAAPVTVSYKVDLPQGAKNVRFYCIDNGESVNADYDGANATGSLEHFSIWTIIYDLFTNNANDTDDIINLINQINAQRNTTTTTTETGTNMTLVVAVAAVAALVVIMMALVVTRKS